MFGKFLLGASVLAMPGIVLGAPVQGQTPTVEFAFSELVTLAKDISPGATAYGRRNIVPITGGTFEGPNIRGQIMPGGWDWQLQRADGCADLRADYMLKTDDGAVINIVNQGSLCAPKPGEPLTARTLVRFEAPLGKYEWLSKHAFVGTLELAPQPNGTPAVRIGIWMVK
jgi:hypothetical protein